MSYLVKKGLMMQGAAVWLPLDADVLVKHTKDSPTQYTKNTTSAYDGYAQRNIVYQVDNEMKFTAISQRATSIIAGLMQAGGSGAYNSFDYGIHLYETIGRYRVVERGTQKYEVLTFVANDECRIKKTAGAAEYYLRDILQYTSLQNFSGGTFTVSIFHINKEIREVYYKV